MTEESDGSKNAPGSGAGDAAPTQAIPRMTKPAAKKATPPAKGAASKPAPSAAAPSKPEASKSAESKPAASKPVPSKAPAAKKATPSSTQTDKGRPRQGAAAPQAKSQPEPSRQVKPAGGPTGRPLTAADYARTTKTSPAATAVIPAIKDNTKDGLKVKPAQAPSVNEAAGVGRRASLRLTHVEPWSVTRLAFAISVAMMIVAVVAVGIFWQVLNFVGVWDQINDSFTTVLSDDTGSFNVTDYFGFGRVMGLTLVLSAVNVILMTVLATIAAHLYNLAAQLMGGVEVTFAEEK